MKKIALMGHFGVGNLGDAAIQQAMIEHIRFSFPDALILGISLNPDDTEKRYHIPSVSIGRMATYGWHGTKQKWEKSSRLIQWVEKLRVHPNPYISKLQRTFLFIPLETFYTYQASKSLIGFDVLSHSGGQFDDPWGGPFHHPYTFLVWALIAKIRKVKVFYVSSGGGPLKSKLSRLFIRWALSLTNYCSFRDQQSREYMEQIGAIKNAPVYPDLAHSLLIDRYLVQQINNASQKIVGIGPMCYFDPRFWPQKDQSVYENYLNKLAAFVSWLLEKNYRVVLLPGEATYDRNVILDLLEILKRNQVRINDNQVCSEPILTVDELMHSISQLDLVVSSRFHGVLLSLLLNKPVIALSYHKKVDELMADVGEADYCLPINSFDVETLKNSFIRLERNQGALKEKMAGRIAEYRSALDEQYEHVFSKF